MMDTTKTPPQNNTITRFDGVRVGLWTDTTAITGVAVIVFDGDTTAAAEVRGAAPGTREYGLLGPGMTVPGVNAIVLAGGSAFGLGAADGVMQGLRDDERGYATKFGLVPIVAAAVVYDLGSGDPRAYPTADDGAVTYRQATGDIVPSGPVGPGIGCTVSKWRGSPQPGGLGCGAATVGEVTVAALTVVNATGDLFDLDGTALTGGPHEPGAPELMAYGENTTLALIVTDTPFSRHDLGRLIVRAHDAFGVTIRPAHTRYDGDIVFAVSTGTGDSNPKFADAAGEAAFIAVGRAIADAASPHRQL